MGLGGIYAWSTFAPVLRNDFGYSAAQTQFVFGLTVSILCFGSIFSGRMQDLLGPRITACTGAVLTGLGYLVAGFFGNRFWGLLTGISLLCGLGVAFGYITALATAVKWFPERRGFATGLVVAGYGSAAIILSSAGGILLANAWPVLKIFKLAGIIYGPALLLSSIMLSVPSDGIRLEQAKQFRRRGLLIDRRFWRLTIGIACGTYPGLALIGSLKPVGLWHNMDLFTATASISALAIGNALGRISWGIIHDRSRANSDLILLASVCLSVLIFAASGFSGTSFLLASGLLGFGYGGSLVVFPSEVSRIYGTHVMGSIYTMVLAGHGIAALAAAPLTGLGVDLTGGYWPGIILAFIAAATGLAVNSWIARRASSSQPAS